VHAGPAYHVPGLPTPGRCLVMGVVNVTPDSFSDGGLFLDPDAAVAHGLEFVAQGADLVDVGGESTRPGAHEVPLEDELARVVPVIEALVQRTSVPISVDTSKPEVMRAAVAAGAREPQAVVEVVYADVDRALWPAAELSVRAQLAYLGTAS